MTALQKAIARLAGTSPQGKAFFHLACLALAEGLECRWAGIMRLCDDGKTVDCLAWVADGKIGEDYSYTLAGTPCEMVYRRAGTDDPHWFVETDLASKYPDDEALERLGAESYRGEIFFDAEGAAAGHVFAMNDKAGVDSQEARSFFRLLSQRIGSEYHRWHAEEALAASEEKYRRIVENAAEGIYRTGPDGSLLEANLALARIHGCDSPEDFLAHFPKSTEVYADPLYREQLIGRLLRDGHVTNFELPVRRKDGSVAWVSLSGRSVRDAERNLLGYEGFVSDITEQRQMREELGRSEALLSQATKLAGLGCLVWDTLEERCLYASDGLFDLLEVSPDNYEAQSALPPGNLQYVHPEDRDHYLAEMAKLRSGSDIAFECRLVTAKGETRHMRHIAKPTMDDEDRVVREIGVSQDITDMKKAEQQLYQAQKMEAVGQLTGGIAHDFNNLLGIIIGNLELVVDNFENTALAGRYIATAAKAADRGAVLTQRLLAFSRKQPLHPQAVDLKQMTLGIRDLLQRTLGEAIDIRLTSDPDLWPCRADPAQLESAVLNLAINARDAMHDGGTLAIAARNVQLGEREAAAHGAVQPGDYVLLSVTDTGAGMPADVREHAFEPFFTTKGAGHGSGLGLSMVYGFAKQSGGHANIRSRENDGTTIEIHLPRDSSEVAGNATRESPDGLPMARGETVLVVEDDVDLRTLVVNILKSLDYEVLEAGSGASALEQLESAPYVSLLFTDLILPGGIGGKELADEVEKRRPGLPVLFMSGYTEDSIIHHGRLDEGFRMIEKPFRKSDIAHAIRTALDRGW